MNTIVITGNAGSGKSTLLTQLGNAGIHTISADQINISLRNYSSFTNNWIQDIANYQTPQKPTLLNDTEIRLLFMSSPEFKAQLEYFLHYIIYQNIALQRQTGKSPLGITAIEIPVYFESGSRFELSDVNHIIIITSNSPTLIDRLIKRPSIDRDGACSLLNNQLADKFKFVNCSDIIINNGSELKLSSTSQKLLSLFK